MATKDELKAESAAAIRKRVESAKANTYTGLWYRVTYLEPGLGTATNNPDVYREFIAAGILSESEAEEELKAMAEAKVEQEIGTLPKRDVVATVDDGTDVDKELDKVTTFFHRDEAGNRMLYDYQIRGFFKEACGDLSRCGNHFGSSLLRAYKKEISGNVFVYPRQIILHPPKGLSVIEPKFLTRPLRAQTAKGERVALVRSEMIPNGCWFDINVVCLNPDCHEPLVGEWMDHGRRKGLGCWRNASYGRIGYRELSPEERPKAFEYTQELA